MNTVSVLLKSVLLCGIAAVVQSDVADWMKGEYGVGIRFPAADWIERRFPNDPPKWDELALQLKTVGATWAIVNLSSGEYGDKWMAPHSVLSEISPPNSFVGCTHQSRYCGATPSVDHFGDILTALKAQGIKVIAYVSAEGPSRMKHGARDVEAAYDLIDTGSCDKLYTNCLENCCSHSMQGWLNHVKDHYGVDTVWPSMLRKGFAEIIVGEYAARYGTDLDGWFFDDASFADIGLLTQTTKEHNPDAVLSFYKKGDPVGMTNPGREDFTAGMPKPFLDFSPSDDANEDMILAIESTADGYFTDGAHQSLGHCYMPIGLTYEGVGFINEWQRSPARKAKAEDWFGRVLVAGGSWTWSVHRAGNTADNYFLMDQADLEFVANTERKSIASPENDVAEKAFPECLHKTAEECSALIHSVLGDEYKVEFTGPPTEGKNGYNAVAVAMDDDGSVKAIYFPLGVWKGQRTGPIRLDFADLDCNDSMTCCTEVLHHPDVENNPDELGNPIQCWAAYGTGTWHDRNNYRIKLLVDADGYVTKIPIVG